MCTTKETKKDGIVYYCTFPEKNFTQEQKIARAMLKKGFLEFFGREFEEEFVKIGRHGKPYYDGFRFVQFNISHCKTGAAAVVSNVPVGIDVERMRRVNVRTVVKCCSMKERSYIFEKAACQEEKVLSTEEMNRFLKLWTLKESYVKMTGEGFSHALWEIPFDLEGISEKEQEPIFLAENGRGVHSCLYLTKQLYMALSVLKKEHHGNVNFEWKTFDLSDKIEI